MMDINDLRAIATVLTTVSFLAVFFWAYSSKNKSRFEEAANLPFADDAPVADETPDSKQHKMGEQE